MCLQPGSYRHTFLGMAPRDMGGGGGGGGLVGAFEEEPAGASCGSEGHLCCL